MSLVRNGSISSMDQAVDKKRYDENYTRIFGHDGPVRTYQPSKVVLRDKSKALDYKDSSISLMMKDKTMVRMIRDGKASDRGLKREAERIERENTNRPKMKFREQQLQKLEAARRELRRSQQ